MWPAILEIVCNREYKLINIYKLLNFYTSARIYLLLIVLFYLQRTKALGEPAPRSYK